MNAPTWLRAAGVTLAAPRTIRALSLTLCLALVIRAYWFIGSANHAGEWPRYMDYYDLLAEGFRGGHLYVPVEPNPKLLQQANPYDPQYSRLWHWDLSLFRGHYYLYWGPVPAMLQALAKSALRVNRIVGDQYLVFAMFSLGAGGGTLILERLQRRLFPRLPLWLLLLAVLAFGLANPAPHLVASGGVYQASIAAGQAFLLLGLVFAFDAVWEAQTAPASAHRLVLAGAVWALSLGSRVSIALTLGVLTVLTATATIYVASPRRARPWREALRATLLLAAPLAVGSALLLAYNQLRFGSLLEFGTNVQVTTLKFKLSTDYWLANVYTYVLRPFKSDCHFPYAMAPWYPAPKDALAGWLGVPEGYLINEPVVGWLRVIIVSWWIPIGLVVARRKARALAANGAEPGEVNSVDGVYVFCTAVFGVMALLTALVVLGLYMATMRYLADVTNGLVLLGVLGLFSVCTSQMSFWKRFATRTAAAASLLATIAFGLLLGYQGYTGHFKQFNPKLDAKLQKRFSVCDKATSAAK